MLKKSKDTSPSVSTEIIRPAAPLSESFREPFEERLQIFVRWLREPLEPLVAHAVEGINADFHIRDNDGYVAARERHKQLGMLLRGAENGQLSVEAQFAPYSKMADKIHKAITGARGALAQVLENARGVLSRAITDYELAQERIRLQKEAEARAQQELEARREQLRLLAAALLEFSVALKDVEKQLGRRLSAPTDADIQRVQGILREHQELAAAAKAKAEQQEAAEQARRLGHPELAREIEHQPVQPEPPPPLPAMPVPTPAPPVVQSTIPHIAGSHTRENWTFRIKNPDLIPREYLVPDDPLDPTSYPKIARVVRAMKQQTSIPGIEPYCTYTAVDRRT